MTPPQLPLTPQDSTSILRWINDFRRVMSDWMRRVEQNKQIVFFGPYLVTGTDVTAGVITVSSRLSTIHDFSYRVQTAVNNNAEVPWTGTVTKVEGALIFTSGGATPFVAGHLLSVQMQGE